MIINPNKGVILIEVDMPQTQDADGIWIQEEWKELPPTGVVWAASDESKYKEGQKVFFERFSAIATPFGENIRACREEAILATMEDDA